MKTFRVYTAFNHSQVTLVIADNMAEAERIFLKAYEYAMIEKIELISSYVQRTTSNSRLEGKSNGSRCYINKCEVGE